MRNLLLTSFMILFCSSAFCQVHTTVTFKPDSIIGKDANIFTTGTCILHGHPLPAADENFGNHTELLQDAWTWSSQGCGEGTVRSLLKFEQLSTIPASATIESAELKLFGVPTSGNYQGNSSYPGSSFSENRSLIQRVTSPWDEQTVTWNTQPTTTTVNQITIPPSTSQWNWNFSDNSASLVAMVQDMVNNPATNFGFMIRLVTEVRYRSLLFASSDHNDRNLWPELTVRYSACPTDTIVVHDTVYVHIPCPCEANFTYLVNTLKPNSYYFTAPTFPSNFSTMRPVWYIDGVAVSHEISFIYDFKPGTHRVCFRKDRECERCITICVEGVTTDTLIHNNPEKSEPIKPDNIQEPKEEKAPTVVPQGVMPPGDFISFDTNKIEVYPNPTKNEWTVKIVAEKEETVNIRLADSNGRIIYADSKALTLGNNAFVVKVNNLAQGSYFLQIIGNTIQFSNVLLKE